MKNSYIRTKFTNFVNVSEIVTIHYHEFDERFKFNGEVHNFWEMVYVDSGSVEITRENESFILKQGDIVFHQPNEFHKIKSHNSSPNIFVISFVCKSTPMNYLCLFKASLNKSLKPFISSIMSEAKNTYVILKNNPDLKKLELKPDAPIGGEQLIKTYLEQFLIILIRDILNKNAPPLFPYKENTESKLVSEIKEYMKSKISEKLTAKDICNHFGYSKTHLSTLFKTQCSTSLMQYFNILKIEYSKKLLRENQYNITQISNALSFDNPQYFSRVFKRVTGLTPSEFINSLEFNN